MFIRVGEERSRSINLTLAGVMALVAGALNAVGFLVAGSFTANMTGNIAMFTEYLAKADVVIALSFAGLVVAFIGGAMVAAFVIQTGRQRGNRKIYSWVVMAEAALLVGLGILADGITEAQLVVALSFVMGLQNAMTTMISKAQVRTTHVSGMATDIGIELAALVGPEADRRESIPKLWLHSLTLACFAIGGLIGVLVYGVVASALFIGVGSLLALLSLQSLIVGR